MSVYRILRVVALVLGVSLMVWRLSDRVFATEAGFTMTVSGSNGGSSLADDEQLVVSWTNSDAAHASVFLFAEPAAGGSAYCSSTQRPIGDGSYTFPVSCTSSIPAGSFRVRAALQNALNQSHGELTAPYTRGPEATPTPPPTPTPGPTPTPTPAPTPVPCPTEPTEDAESRCLLREVIKRLDDGNGQRATQTEHSYAGTLGVGLLVFLGFAGLVGFWTRGAGD